MNRFLSRAAAFAVALVVLSCGGGSRGRFAMHLQVAGLPPLGAGKGSYEGWAVVLGGVASTGKFDIDASTNPARVILKVNGRVLGTVDDALFGPSDTGLGNAFPFVELATEFFITIEPDLDADGVPSGNVVMAGPVVGRTCQMTVAGQTATGGRGLADFTGAGGTFVLTTPTDGPGNDGQGLWFVTDASGATPGLALPALSGTWTYEAFLERPGFPPASLGKFRDPAFFDDDFRSNVQRGAVSVGFVAPGQDFVNGATVTTLSALTLNDGFHTVRITAEPNPDDGVGPSPFVILEAAIPTDAVDANHFAARDVLLTNPMTLPRYDATAAPGALTLTTPVGASPLPSAGPGVNGGPYEVFAVVNGVPQSAGVFLVLPADVETPGGTPLGTAASFQLTAANTGLGAQFPDLAQATEIFVTLEPPGDPVPAPSASVLLAGALVGGQAALTTAGLTAVGGRGLADFGAAAGAFIVRTPTDDGPGTAADDERGLWFRTLGSGAGSLALPTLPPGWKYEAWIVDAGGAAQSMGKFSRPDRADDDAMIWPGRGSVNTGFNVPGQDFVVPVAPTTLTPITIAGAGTVVVTVERTPDDAVGPSALRILEAPLPATTGAPFPLANVFGTPASPSPSGRVTF